MTSYEGMGVATPVYENCNPLDSLCVARNLAKDNDYNAQVVLEQNAQHLQWCLTASGYPAAQCQAMYGPGGYIDQTANAGQPMQYAPPVVPSTTNVSNGLQMNFLTSGVGSNLHVGDNWTITISGGIVGQNVSVKGGQNGASSNTNMGVIGSDGRFILSGKFDSGSIGSWHEEWSVGSTFVGTLSFNVSSVGTTGGKSVQDSSGYAPTTNTKGNDTGCNPLFQDCGVGSSTIVNTKTGVTTSVQDFLNIIFAQKQSQIVPPSQTVVPQSQATGLTSQAPTTTTQDTATNASMFDLFGTMDNNITIPGTNVEVGVYTAMLVVGVVAVGYMMTSSKKGRY